MSHTDKFEFKKIEHLPDPLCDPTRTRNGLNEYRQLIIELYELVNTLNAKVEQQEHHITAEKEVNRQNQEAVRNLKKSDIALQRKYQEESERGAKLRQNMETCLKSLKAKQQEIKELHEVHRGMEYSGNRILELEAMIMERQCKLARVEEMATALNAENQQLRAQVVEREHQTEWEIKELKMLNKDLKDKFESVEFLSPQKVSQFDLLNQQTQLGAKRHKEIRSMSTERKPRRNNGFLVTAEQKSNRKMTPYGGYHKMAQYGCSNNMPQYGGCNNHQAWPDQKGHRNRQNLLNPEVTEQLMSIKSQIANQYTLINLKKETCNKKRVARTLDLLQQRMKKMVKSAEEEGGTASSDEDQ